MAPSTPAFTGCTTRQTYNLLSDVLSVVDQTHLPNVVQDRVTGSVLGSTHEVVMKSRLGNKEEKFIVALFLNIPANNCAILQKGTFIQPC